MSTECDRIADQLYRMVQGDAWHGLPLEAVLTDVPPEMAALHSIPGADGIWELVHHMAAWAAIAQRRLDGEIVEVSPTDDWPPVGAVTRDAWTAALDALERSHADLRHAVLALGDGHLEDRTPGKPYTLYVLLHVVQHAAYHAGQIAVIKRAVAGSR
jgi:uncharacterized damage-inducible protein DinB